MQAMNSFAIEVILSSVFFAIFMDLQRFEMK